MALYTHTTFLEAKTAIRQRLGLTFWTDLEAGLLLREGLRWWGAATQRWRDRLTDQLTTNQHWYDLPTLFPSMAPTVLDQDLLVEIQHHLLEPVSTTTWPGSSQFDLTQVTDAIQSAQDFLLAQSLSLTRTAHPVPLGPRFSLAGISPTRAILYIRRANWMEADGTHHHLRRADEDQSRFYQPRWNVTPDIPRQYSIAATPPLELAFSPPPNAPGELELIYQLAGPLLDPTVGVGLVIPDALSWAVKWGALADLLSKEGEATDPTRQRYALQRFDEGLRLAAEYTPALEAELDGTPANIASMFDIDNYRPGWRNEPSAQPDQIAFMGYNLFAVAPAPDAQPHSILFDAVIPAPIPVADGDNIQLGKDELEAVIDYSHHIGAFKQGGQEFLTTIERYRQARDFAGELNSRYKAVITAQQAMMERAREEDRKRILVGARETRVPRERINPVEGEGEE